jgi:hypothetical protein
MSKSHPPIATETPIVAVGTGRGGKVLKITELVLARDELAALLHDALLYVVR